MVCVGAEIQSKVGVTRNAGAEPEAVCFPKDKRLREARLCHRLMKVHKSIHTNNALETTSKHIRYIHTPMPAHQIKG